MTYFPTGNEFVALPTIAADCTIESLNVLSMGARGLLEISGDPFLRCELEIDGVLVDMAGASWEMQDSWIPVARLDHGDVSATLSFVAPRETRGWFLRVTLETGAPHDVVLRLRGQFSALLHSINETKPVDGRVVCYRSLWNAGLMWDFRNGLSLLSFGFLTEGGFDSQEDLGDGAFRLEKRLTTAGEPVGSRVQDVFMGLGLEEVGAATQAIHMQRVTGDVLLAETRGWLAARRRCVGDAQLDEIVNRNLFFNYFYASGRTFDTEELVLVTSRSPRYYVSAAYWDRDSLIWSFPALLAVDSARAREALDYVFGRQMRNIGVHSRYIDGTVLEPGFELDELCAPLLALDHYVQATGDRAYLLAPQVRRGVELIRRRLGEWKHPGHDLYGTFLMPTDDMHRYPYLTYNNVLVWKVLGILAEIDEAADLPDLAEATRAQAERVRAAILRHCVTEIGGVPQFVWSTDLAGQFDVYDEPPGSLTLLAHLGFCAADDPVFVNTLKALYSPAFPHYFGDSNFPDLGCTHADHPWVLAIANSLLNGRHEVARDMLRRAPMDNLIACESIDAMTGKVATGAHFATCAGFLAHALIAAAGAHPL